MKEQTFQTTASAKEDIEWLRVWCENTNASARRVLLIGDSITENYQALVREKLADIAAVDYIAASYSVRSEFYRRTVPLLARDSQYALIQFNFGLHAFGLNAAEYESGCREIIAELVKTSRVAVATSTVVLDGAGGEDALWSGKLRERNAALKALAQEFGLPVNDLGELSRTIPQSMHLDNVHYLPEGNEILGNRTAQFLRGILESEKTD